MYFICTHQTQTCFLRRNSTGACARVLADHPLRAVVFREALDIGDAARREEVMRALRAPMPSGPGLSLGVSPHAGYTVSDALLQEIGADLGARELPVQVHWNETREEVEWESARRSAFDGLVMPSPERPTLERLDAAGLLRRPASLVHANFPGEGDAGLIRDRGVVIVHCPGAHAWFDRGDFDVESWWGEGVDVALGTDSLAGNAALDMGREVSLFRDTHPGASPGEAFDMATRAGARALGPPSAPPSCATLCTLSSQSEVVRWLLIVPSSSWLLKQPKPTSLSMFWSSVARPRSLCKRQRERGKGIERQRG